MLRTDTGMRPTTLVAVPASSSWDQTELPAPREEDLKDLREVTSKVVAAGVAGKLLITHLKVDKYLQSITSHKHNWHSTSLILWVTSTFHAYYSVLLNGLV
uniref:Uncharacterized protein n=1 Tax=Homalodisca liturata TaxID=320908 RepID=A0A1B6JNG0_9HEMI